MTLKVIHLTFRGHYCKDFSAPGFEGDSIEKSIVLPAAPYIEADVSKLEMWILEAVEGVTVGRYTVRYHGYRDAGTMMR